MRSKGWVSTLARGGVLLLPFLSGCSMGTDLSNPEWVRVVLSSDSTFSLELLTSQKFLVTEASVQLMESTTDTISVPYDKTYTLGAPARIYIRLGNVGQQSVSFRCKIVMEEKTWMDEDKTLAPGEQVEFVYRYDMPTPNG